MKDWILNLLASRLGAWLAPLISGALAAACTWLVAHVPALEGKVSPDLLFAVILGALMIGINAATNLRAAKYGKVLQRFINQLGRPYGIEVRDDGVVGAVTVAGAVEVAKVVADPSGPSPKDVTKAVERVKAEDVETVTKVQAARPIRIPHRM